MDADWRPVKLSRNGHSANGNGHHVETTEPQRTLFSRAEVNAALSAIPEGSKHGQRLAVRVGVDP